MPEYLTLKRGYFLIAQIDLNINCQKYATEYHEWMPIANYFFIVIHLVLKILK